MGRGGPDDGGDMITETAPAQRQLSSTGTGASGGLQAGLRLGGCARHASINVNRGGGREIQGSTTSILGRGRWDWGPELRGSEEDW